MPTIGDRIRQRREQIGMSQAELAVLSGYKSRASINKIELGERDIRQNKIKAIADALHTSPAYLMGWEDAPDSKEKPSEDEKTAPELSESVKKLINVMSQLTPENQRIVLAAAKGFLQEQNEGEDK